MTSAIVLASNNAGKLAEFNQLLSTIKLKIVAQDTLNIGAAQETGLSFVENAILKARHASAQAQLPAIADDSGLEVDYLRGAPGIYSSRYAGTHGDDAANNHKLLEALAGVAEPARTARFQCLLVYMRHAADPTPLICQGTWEGRILTAPLGTNGFGYDPLFFVPERQCSAAQLDPQEKNRLSHRARAMTSLLAKLGA